MSLTQDQLEQLAAELEGSCQELWQVMERLGIHADASEAEAALLSMGIEPCQGCGCWMASGALLDLDGEASGYCEPCRPMAERANDPLSGEGLDDDGLWDSLG